MILEIAENTDVSFDFDYEKIAKEVMERVLLSEDFPYEAEVSLTLTDEKEIRDLNSRFRDIDRATDVLSFPMLSFPENGILEADEKSDMLDPDTGCVVLGDIVLCVPKVFSQAKEYGHSPLREYAFLITHSMLHLLGYDHINEEERRLMEDRQNEILDFLGIKR